MVAGDFRAIGLSLVVFGFLAAMAWTGWLVGVDGTRVGLFRWLVEDIVVGHLGRRGATMLFLAMGLGSVALARWVRRLTFQR